MGRRNEKAVFFKREQIFPSVINLPQTEEKAGQITGYVVKDAALTPFTVTLGDLTDEERQIILKGCLINYNRVDG